MGPMTTQEFATAGKIVLLRQVFLEHALTEVGGIPRGLFALRPWFRGTLSVNDIHQVQCKFLRC